MKPGTINLTFEHRETYLYALVTGEDSYENCLSSWTQITEKVKAFGLNRVLVHEELTGRITEGELFSLLQEIIPLGIGIRIAFFDPDIKHEAFNLLGGLVAQNRGIDVQMFKSLEEAEQWITESSE